MFQSLKMCAGQLFKVVSQPTGLPGLAWPRGGYQTPLDWTLLGTGSENLERQWQQTLPQTPGVRFPSCQAPAISFYPPVSCNLNRQLQTIVETRLLIFKSFLSLFLNSSSWNCLLLANFCVAMLSHVWFFATLWTIALKVPLSVGFSRQEYWSGLLFPSPGDLPDSGIEPASPALAGVFFTAEPLGSPTWE